MHNRLFVLLLLPFLVATARSQCPQTGTGCRCAASEALSLCRRPDPRLPFCRPALCAPSYQCSCTGPHFCNFKPSARAWRCDRPSPADADCPCRRTTHETLYNLAPAGFFESIVERSGENFSAGCYWPLDFWA